jgi:hypothetical protein
MKIKRFALGAMVAIAFGASAQTRPNYNNDSDEAYRQGFKEGYSKGYREGLAEGERRAANLVPPPPPVAPPPPPKPAPNGPIRIQGAFYGTSSKNCNATHWLARRVDGRTSANVEVENKICGDPAPGARKSLEVTYLCGTFPKTASAYEHRTLYLDCTP